MTLPTTTNSNPAGRSLGGGAQKKVLYISYDGMTDPLGQSQVIPYLGALAEGPYEFTILSFEKADRFSRDGKMIQDLLASRGIGWVPLRFTTFPTLAAKLYDAVKMRRTAFALHRKRHYAMTHCRSYIAAGVGMELKRRGAAKFLFDMRGFWADEKRDSGAWDQGRFVYRQIYRYYKKKEAEYLQEADGIVVLTEAGKTEMANWKTHGRHVPAQVIPCCADLEHFSLTDAAQRASAKEALALDQSRLVVSYLGSVGTWYMLDEMLRFFSVLKKRSPTAVFLIVTPSDPRVILGKLSGHGLGETDVRIVAASRAEVPRLMKASDVNISFIMPVYSKISSSPTKLGEVLSMGIPVICNRGIGDVTAIVSDSGAGLVLEDFEDSTFGRVVQEIPQLLNLEPERIRATASKWFDLRNGIELYRKVYQEVLA